MPLVSAAGPPSSATDPTEPAVKQTPPTNPVKNLSLPSEDINTEPCLLVFLDGPGLDAAGRELCARQLLDFAVKQIADEESTGRQPLPVYCGVSAGGAMAQIKELLGLGDRGLGDESADAVQKHGRPLAHTLGPGGPVVVVLNMPEGRFYPLEVPGLAEGKIALVTTELLDNFLLSWRRKNISGRCLAGVGVEEGRKPLGEKPT